MEELLKKEGICLATTDKLIKDSGVAAASAYDKIIYNLRKTNVRGVIVFGSDQVRRGGSCVREREREKERERERERERGGRERQRERESEKEKREKEKRERWRKETEETGKN